MMIERSFTRRNRTVTLRELTDIVAVHSGTSSASDGPSAQVPPDVSALLPAVDVDRFRDAGWSLQSAAEAQLPPGAARARVFLKEDGHVALGANVLTIQLSGNPSAEAARAALETHHARVLERLTFAPGLFRIQVSEDAPHDAIELANQLNQSDQVVFAEPELIEAIGPRSAGQ